MSHHELTLGTAGHIDHGKTALIRALTGIETDRLDEEKDRGISIDLGFAYLDLGERRVGIVDVPGHERFIRNMLAGASGIDVAVLVVAADDSVMPQTREHLAILRLLQVRQGVVVVTKCDLAEPGWLDLVEEDIRELAAGSFLDGAPIVRTSATTGEGLDELKSVLARLCDETEPRRTGDFFRLAVDRAFALQGLGTLVTGTVWTGAAGAGDEVEWQPVGRTLRIRSLQSHGRDADAVVQGQRAALNVMGAHHSEMQRGHVLATPGFLRPANRITMRVDVLAESPWPLRHRARVRLHVGTQEVIARVWLLRGTVVERGHSELAQLITAEPVATVARQPLVIRSESPLRTIGGGVVLQPVAASRSRRDAAAIERLADLCDDDPAVRAAAAIFFAGADGLTDVALCRDADLTRDEVATVIGRLDGKGITMTLSAGQRRTIRVHRDFHDQVREQIFVAARRLHEASPLETRITRKRLGQAMGWLDAELVEAVVQRMIDRNEIAGDERTMALPEFEPVLTEAQRRLRTVVDDAYKQGGFAPPEPDDVAKTAGVGQDQLRPIIQLCASEGVLTHLGGKMYLHRDWEAELRRRMQSELSGGRGLTVSEIRGVLDTSRKYAVPMCEYLDRIGFTRRENDVRVLA